MYATGEALALLAEEESTLGKLLYRNQNQHGKSKLFAFLKRVKRCLPFLQRDRVSELCRAGESVLRLKTTSASTSDVSQRLECLRNQHKAKLICLEGSEYCVKALEVLKDQLGRLLFVPLFTTLLAATSRILQCLVSILTAVHAQHQALIVQLNNVSLLSPKHQPAIAGGIAQVQLASPRDALLLDALISAPPPTAAAAAAALAPAPDFPIPASNAHAPAANDFDDDLGEEVVGLGATTAAPSGSSSSSSSNSSKSHTQQLPKKRRIK